MKSMPMAHPLQERPFEFLRPCDPGGQPQGECPIVRDGQKDFFVSTADGGVLCSFIF